MDHHQNGNGHVTLTVDRQNDDQTQRRQEPVTILDFILTIIRRFFLSLGDSFTSCADWLRHPRRNLSSSSLSNVRRRLGRTLSDSYLRTTANVNSLASNILAASSVMMTALTFASQYIQDDFLKENIGYFFITLCLLSVGVIGGFFYLITHNNGYGGHSSIKTLLGFVSVYLIYYGQAFWMVTMLTYSTSQLIKIISCLAVGVVPLLIGLSTYYCNNQDVDASNQDGDTSNERVHVPRNTGN